MGGRGNAGGGTKMGGGLSSVKRIMDYPAMTGTDRQIAYAKDILQKPVDNMYRQMEAAVQKNRDMGFKGKDAEISGYAYANAIKEYNNYIANWASRVRSKGREFTADLVIRNRDQFQILVMNRIIQKEREEYRRQGNAYKLK